MLRRILPYAVISLVSIAIGGVLQPFAHITASAQPGCQTFKETGKTVCGKFLTYWQQHGGLAQQGFPISGEFNEVSDLNGKPYTVQYFERAVFEKHPENAAPNDVLLSQLGTFQFRKKYPNGEPAAQPTAQPNPGASKQFTGSGVTDSYSEVTLKAGPATFHSSSTGGALDVTLLTKDKSNKVAKLAEIAGAGDVSITVNVPAADTYLVHVEHNNSGDWTVRVDQ